ncbi:hypothetical protein N0V93_007399 [Gnomoniopsis smithogilvyi]|uniref:Asteroid domain-containing protein n=1 Tax=Gnomoniopsis smithogilvyi TaxID=1191159 RepID=A0A9W8YRI2_9PEZI|nr:hypothetical protein N0V93_007399 [Gnomoniopsis smithogilvyi]
MGIRGLTNVLKQYASREELCGRVVIDGPAMAYHILWIARHNVATILDEPPYSLLAATAIQWLNRLESHGLEVGAIYFDGSLPTSKKEERHRRICERSHEAQKYFLNTISGIKANGQVPKRFVPDPTFHVPAILEGLHSQARYRDLTYLVPGEADPYCAADVKQNGGILLTSDSDLLLYDLGPTGSVVFLKDLQLDLGAMGEASSISAVVSRPSELCRRMSLEQGQASMLRFGFEMKVRPCYNLKGLPHQSEWAYLEEAYDQEFAAFIREYDGSPDLSSTALDHKSFLDPRISEFVLDWSKLGTSKDPASPKGLTVWLPSLVDRWDRASAWDLGTTIRQLAYSLYQYGDSSRFTVMEYRRTLSTRSAGQAVEVLDEPDVLEATASLLEHVDRFIKNATVPRRLQWITMCLSLEIGHAAQENKESNALGLWRKAAKAEGRLDPSNWDAVHLTAQILGTLYSLRILQQVLSIWKGGSLLDAVSSDQVKRLQTRLSTLPTLAEFPAATEMEELFEHLHREGQLDIISEAVRVPTIIFRAKGETSQRLKNRQPRAKRREQKPTRARAPHSQASANPFEALSPGN